ncbi:MAG: squalene/phytoene synthase family protein [Alphaproteobacteria bacterium]|nr:squalene/phytoene synthase family protein [Alphaproteobacteria bacterium]
MSEAASATALSPLAKTVYEKDRDRFLTVMLLPKSLREDVFTIYALNHELSKVSSAVSEATLGHIRLQWWREAIEECFQDNPRRHEITRPLAELMQRRNLSKSLFDQMLDAREDDLLDDPIQRLDHLMVYADKTGGNILRLALQATGISDENTLAAAGRVGTAWALVGLMRALPFHLREKKQWLPEELVSRHKIDGRAMRDLAQSDELNFAVREICDIAENLISEARELRVSNDKNAVPLLQLAGLAKSYCKQLSQAQYNPYDSSLAIKPSLRVLKVFGLNLINRF